MHEQPERTPEHGVGRSALQARRAKVFEMRIGGSSFAEIADALSISKSQAHGDFKAEQRAVAKLDDGDTATRRVTANARLDRLLLPLMREAGKGNTKAAAEAIKAIQRQAEMWGPDAPRRNQHTVDASVTADVHVNHDWASKAVDFLVANFTVEELRVLREGATVGIAWRGRGQRRNGTEAHRCTAHHRRRYQPRQFVEPPSPTCPVPTSGGQLGYRISTHA